MKEDQEKAEKEAAMAGKEEEEKKEETSSFASFFGFTYSSTQTVGQYCKSVSEVRRQKSDEYV